MSGEESKHWLFVATTSQEVEWEQIDLPAFDIPQGHMRRPGVLDSYSRRLFLIGTESGDKVEENTAEETAEEIMRLFLGMLSLVCGLGLEYTIHSATEISKEECSTLEQLKDGHGKLPDFANSLEVLPRRGALITYPESSMNTPALKKLQEDFIEFINDKIYSDRHDKIRSVWGMIYDGERAITNEQGFLTRYTALNLLVKDIGRSSNTAKSQAEMAIKFVDRDVIDSSVALALLNKLDDLHTSRNNVFFGGQDIGIRESADLNQLLQTILIWYMEYIEEDNPETNS